MVLCTNVLADPVAPAMGFPCPSCPSWWPFCPPPTISTSIALTPVGFIHVPVLAVVSLLQTISLCVTTPVPIERPPTNEGSEYSSIKIYPVAPGSNLLLCQRAPIPFAPKGPAAAPP